MLLGIIEKGYEDEVSGEYVSRHAQREKVRKVPLNVTVDKELAEFIDRGMEHRIFSSKSHAVSWALTLLQNQLRTQAILQQQAQTGNSPENQQHGRQ